ncbi:MAG: DUF5680 domain-containing protein [Candidatus Nanoarchaeia archaeon]|jgi:predicted small secreted protein
MNINLLESFIVKAKINTYANNAKELTLNDGGRELTFELDGFKYRDRYYGFNPFIGEELIWAGETIVWSMNYYGLITSDSCKPEIIYSFLRESLKQVSNDKPFRGPEQFKQGELEYINEIKGDINQFIGTERILNNKTEVYKLCYHGGIMKIKDKN